MLKYIDTSVLELCGEFTKDFDFVVPMNEIRRIPLTDVAPVVHGKWEYEPETVNTYSVLKCSKCKWWTLDLSVDRVYHYCPNCGAKMDLKESR